MNVHDREFGRRFRRWVECIELDRDTAMKILNRILDILRSKRDEKSNGRQKLR